MTNILQILICPVCGGDLLRDGGSLRCAVGHSFDIARAGYVNLLPPGKEKNSRTGDEREMVRAREEFLSLGYYDKITDTLAELLVKYGAGGTICDMGCGEGYHTCRVVQKLREYCAGEISAIGFDASKYAAERASKRSTRMKLTPDRGIGADFYGDSAAYFMPANIFHLPVRDGSINAALSMFAPIAASEAARILSREADGGGILAVVSSGEEHLIEMRRLIYDEVRLSNELPEKPDGFEDIGRHRLRYEISLDNPATLSALFTMTPFYYKTTEAGRERLRTCVMPLSLTIDVNYSIFKVK